MRITHKLTPCIPELLECVELGRARHAQGHGLGVLPQKVWCETKTFAVAQASSEFARARVASLLRGFWCSRVVEAV